MSGKGIGELWFESSGKDHRTVARCILEQVRDNLGRLSVAASNLQNFSALLAIEMVNVPARDFPPGIAQ